MGLFVYVLVSGVFALLFSPGLKKYDGPPILESRMQKRFLRAASWPDREMFMFHLGMRKMLTGSLFRAAFLMVYWAATGALFFGEKLALGAIPAILLSLPNGFALAVAWYNIRKRF
jgi:hypothetical protein